MIEAILLGVMLTLVTQLYWQPSFGSSWKPGDNQRKQDRRFEFDTHRVARKRWEEDPRATSDDEAVLVDNFRFMPRTKLDQLADVVGGDAQIARDYFVRKAVFPKTTLPPKVGDIAFRLDVRSADKELLERLQPVYAGTPQSELIGRGIAYQERCEQAAKQAKDNVEF